MKAVKNGPYWLIWDEGSNHYLPSMTASAGVSSPMAFTTEQLANEYIQGTAGVSVIQTQRPDYVVIEKPAEKGATIARTVVDKEAENTTS